MVAAMSRNDEIMSLLLGWPDSKSSQDGAKALTHEPAETYPPGIKAQEVSGHQIAGLEQRKFMVLPCLDAALCCFI